MIKFTNEFGTICNIVLNFISETSFKDGDFQVVMNNGNRYHINEAKTMLEIEKALEVYNKPPETSYKFTNAVGFPFSASSEMK